MSLINQALKKEQQRRSSTPNLTNVPMPPAHQALVAKRNKGENNTKILIGTCVAGVSLLVVLTMVSVAGIKRIFNNSESPIARLEQSEQNIPKHFVSDNPNSNTENGKKDFTHDISLTQAPNSELEIANSSQSASSQIESVTSKVETPPAAPLPKANPETQSFLENLNFQAVRLAKENSRLLLDGKVYKIGNLLGEEGNRLVFKGVEGGLLVFEDSNGATYRINS